MLVTRKTMSNAVDKNRIVENLGYRIGLYHPSTNVQIGRGNANANIVVVQPHAKMPDRDAVTGALKNFGVLNDSYRATVEIISGADNETNRYYLKELIEIIRPLVVVTCGQEVTSLLRQRKIRSFKSHTGKRFEVEDLTGPVFYATLNPTEYGFARASQALKAQGQEEWTKIINRFTKLKEKQERERWEC